MKKAMPNLAEQSISFTRHAWESVEETVDDMAFELKDADLIYDVLRNRILPIPFSSYLKRYLYRRSGMLRPFREVTAEDYEAVMLASFHETGTPSSMTSETTRLNRMVRVWLDRDMVQRQTMLLLGFGLAMTEEDVNGFLQKVLHQQSLDPEDPQDALCAFCYRGRHGFGKLIQLQDRLRLMESGAESPGGTAEEEALLRSLLRARGRMTAMRRRTEDRFREIYGQARALIAESSPAGRVTPSTLERLLCASIPMGASGNLVSAYPLREQTRFAAKRLSRQHIQRILDGRQPVSRYDLTSLHFLLFAATHPAGEDRVRMLKDYTDSADALLADCGFGGMMPTDPHDAFLMMCAVSVSPLGTYSDIMEKAYASVGGEGGA